MTLRTEVLLTVTAAIPFADIAVERTRVAFVTHCVIHASTPGAVLRV